jgi:hypothetical protein
MLASSLRLAEPAEGLVDLRHAHIKILRDDPGCWPSLLSLEGLTYEALEPRLPARLRLRWLARDPGGYQPRPYGQLAAHCTAIGQPVEARQVMYASERIQRRTKAPLARTWSLVQDIIIGYGYQPWRAVASLAVILAAGSIVFAIAPPPPTRTRQCTAFQSFHRNWIGLSLSFGLWPVRRASICLSGEGAAGCGTCPLSPCLVMLQGFVLRTRGCGRCWRSGMRRSLFSGRTWMS